MKKIKKQKENYKPFVLVKTKTSLTTWFLLLIIAGVNLTLVGGFAMATVLDVQRIYQADLVSIAAATTTTDIAVAKVNCTDYFKNWSKITVPNTKHRIYDLEMIGNTLVAAGMTLPLESADGWIYEINPAASEFKATPAFSFGNARGSGTLHITKLSDKMWLMSEIEREGGGSLYSITPDKTGKLVYTSIKIKGDALTHNWATTVCGSKLLLVGASYKYSVLRSTPLRSFISNPTNAEWTQESASLGGDFYPNVVCYNGDAYMGGIQRVNQRYFATKSKFAKATPYYDTNETKDMIETMEGYNNKFYFSDEKSIFVRQDKKNQKIGNLSLRTWDLEPFNGNLWFVASDSKVKKSRYAGDGVKNAVLGYIDANNVPHQVCQIPEDSGYSLQSFNGSLFVGTSGGNIYAFKDLP